MNYTKISDTSCIIRYSYRRTDGGVVSQLGSSSSRFPAQSQLDGEKLPPWRRLVMSGRNATTNLTATENKPSPVRLHAWADVPKHPVWLTGPIHTDFWGTQNLDNPPNPVVIPQSLMDKVDLLAREQFLKKYRARRTAFQSGVFFGEIREAVRMIKSPVKALREGINYYYRDVKKRVRRERVARNVRRIVGETWLEYAFGWRPLLRDAEDALKLACLLPDRYSQPIRVMSNISYKETPAVTTKGAPHVGYPFWDEYLQTTYTASAFYRGAASAVMQNPPSFPEQLGLSWSNVLPTAWELIPYSFLVDYFTNVGEVIEGISTGKIFLSWGARTLRRQSVNNVLTFQRNDLLTAATGQKGCRSGVDGSGITGRRRIVNRVPLTSVYLGLTDLRLEVPGLTSLKWLNIAALANLRR